MDISLCLFTWVIVPASKALAACGAAPDSGRFHHLSLAQRGVRQRLPSGRVKGASRDQKTRAQGSASGSWRVLNDVQSHAGGRKGGSARGPGEQNYLVTLQLSRKPREVRQRRKAPL